MDTLALKRTIEGPGAQDERLQEAVELIARGFEAATCTLHVLESATRLLHLRAFTGLPPEVLVAVRTIPVGKGMAGICAERREPVTVCNLQEDRSGVVRPGARETKVSGALVVPLWRGNEVAATLGIGKSREHEYTQDETRRLEACGRILLDAL
jgi:L-methionine (R)-S-oxide reductase